MNVTNLLPFFFSTYEACFFESARLQTVTKHGWLTTFVIFSYFPPNGPHVFDLWPLEQGPGHFLYLWWLERSHRQLTTPGRLLGLRTSTPPVGRFHRYTSNRNSCSSFIKTCFLIHKNLFLLSRDLFEKWEQKGGAFLTRVNKSLKQTAWYHRKVQPC